jgi:hypothetical protein
MADIGGENLTKSVSTKLGSKLGKLYKNRNPNAALETHLKQIYKVLDAKPKVNHIEGNPNALEVIVKHKNNFCPIGGDFKSKEQATFINNNICIPYTLGFLNELDPKIKFKAEIKNCIALNNNKFCHYILTMSEKVS